MRKYIAFEPSKGLPFREGLYYECLKCGKAILGDLKGNFYCDCRNIMIDADYGRITIEDYSAVRLFEEIVT